MVNLLNEVAIKRGAEYVFLNASQLDNLEDRFILWMTPEAFFDQPFWNYFQITMYSLWFYLAFNLIKGFVDRSKGIEVFYKALEATGLVAKINAKISWMLEIIDFAKDWIYLFMFRHRLLPFLILDFSLSFPFALHDAESNEKFETYLIHNFLTFLGITVTEDDRKARKHATVWITFFENVPQFLVVTYEIFDFGFSLNFIQAANPIFTVFMIYKSMGEGLGERLYDIVNK